MRKLTAVVVFVVGIVIGYLLCSNAAHLEIDAGETHIRLDTRDFE